MRKKDPFFQSLLVLIIIFLGSKAGTGQELIWVKNAPGYNDYASATYVDESGYVYKTGGCEVEADYDPGPEEVLLPALSDGDAVYVLKLDPSGNLVWAHTFESTMWSAGRSIVVNAAGEIFVWGDYKHGMDADPGDGEYDLPNVGWRDCFLLKLDASGNFLWAKNIGGSGDEFATDITLDSDENIILTGTFDFSIDCDPGPGVYNLSYISSEYGEPEDFIVKLNAEGEFIWATNIGIEYVYEPGEDFESPEFHTLTADDFDAVYVGGKFHRTIDFNPWGTEAMATAIGEYDGFILKETADGDFDWVRSIEGNSDVSVSVVKKVIPDNVGNLYACGYFSDSVYFEEDVLAGSGGDNDCFIMKLSATDGSTEWYKTFGSDGDDQVRSFCFNPDGSISVVGEFNGTIDVDPGPETHFMTSAGETDIFVLNITAEGAFNWAEHFGNENAEASYAFIGNDTEGRTYITGNIEGEVDFGFGGEVVFMEGEETFAYSGSRLPFLAKISPCFIVRGDTAKEVLCFDGSYLWEETGEVYHSSGMYQAVYESAGGCDSIVYLDLTIDEELVLDGATMEIAACESYTVPSGDETYTSSGVYTDTLSSVVYGCDSLVTIALTIGFSYQSLIVYGCDAYTSPSGSVYTESGAYTEVFTGETGCDSVISYAVTIYPDYEVFDSVHACDSYIAPTGEVYTTSGTYDFLYESMDGCDSLSHVSLEIITIDNGIVHDGTELTAMQEGASYQWVDCNEGYAEIEAETEQNFTPEADGAYAVVIQIGDCADTSDCVDFLHFSIAENEGDAFTVYPNPLTESFTLDFNSVQNQVVLKVYTAAGELVLETACTSVKTKTLEFDRAPGVYWLEIYADSKKPIRKRILKQ